MRERILSAFRVLKRVGFALVMLGIACSMAFGAGTAKPGRRNGSFFVENTGQWKGEFSFMCEVGNAVYYVTPKGMTIDFREVTRHSEGTSRFETGAGMFEENERDTVTVRGHVVQIHFVPPRSSGGGRGGQAVGEQKLSHYSNYFFGRDSTKWRSRVAHYERVVVPEVWPGIDVEYRADQRGVETVYHVKAGADPAQIQMDYLGLDAPLRVDAQGNLILITSLGEVKEQAPYSYQQHGRTQSEVTTSIRLQSGNRIGFTLNHYDASKELVIDPLIYSTRWGGGDEFESVGNIATCVNGRLIICGHTGGIHLPLSPGAYQTTPYQGLGFSGYISCFNWRGDSLICSTYMGGTVGRSSVNSLAADQDCNIWFYGVVTSPGFPTSPDAVDSTFGGSHEGIFGLLSADGTELLYASYLGGSDYEQVSEIRLYDNEDLYLFGLSRSLDFPLTPDALYTEGFRNVGTISLFSVSNRTLEFSSYTGMAINTIFDVIPLPGRRVWWFAPVATYVAYVTDDALQPVLGGSMDGYFARWNLATLEIEYASYFGANTYDVPWDAELIGEDTLVIAGSLSLNGEPHSNFYLTPSAFDTTFGGLDEGFITVIKLPDTILYSTYLGGERYEWIQGLGVMEDGSFVVCGHTKSDSFPVTPDAYDGLLNSGSGTAADAFISVLDPTLSHLTYSTYLGGSGMDQTYTFLYQNPGLIWLAGVTHSEDFPVTPDALGSGVQFGFLSRFSLVELNPCDSIQVTGLVIYLEGESLMLQWQDAIIHEDCVSTDPLRYDVYYSEDGTTYRAIAYTFSPSYTDSNALTRHPRGFYHVTAKLSNDHSIEHAP